MIYNNATKEAAKNAIEQIKEQRRILKNNRKNKRTKTQWWRAILCKLPI